MNVATTVGWVLVVPIALIILFSMYRMYRIRSTYRKYQTVNFAPGVSGQQAGRLMLNAAGLQSVSVQELNANRKPWESYYDMTEKVLRLAPSVYNGTSASDIGMAAFECGHAIEHSEGINAKERQRTGIIALVGANLGLLLFILGIGAATTGQTWGTISLTLGFLIFAGTALLVLSKLPVEKGTARRAEALLEKSGLAPAGSPGLEGAQSMIAAATWYYVGALGSIVGIWFS